jgi:hypothetical protein
MAMPKLGVGFQAEHLKGSLQAITCESWYD